jgi:hypothetical protein
VRAHHLVEALALLFALGAPDHKGSRESLSIRLMSRLAPPPACRSSSAEVRACPRAGLASRHLALLSHLTLQAIARREKPIANQPIERA